MQERESDDWATTPLDRLLARSDDAAHVWLAARLVASEEIDPSLAPEPGAVDDAAVTVSG